MYHQRVKIFAIAAAAILAVCIIRLGQMQFVRDPKLNEAIEQLRLQRTKTLETAAESSTETEMYWLRMFPGSNFISATNCAVSLMNGSKRQNYFRL
jgi:hypothetical protein